MDTKDYFSKLSELFRRIKITDTSGGTLSLKEGTGKAVRMVLSAKTTSRKIMLIGNGGSAAIAQHMQADLCNAVSVRAMVFYDAPVLTAVSNDRGYQHVFECSVRLWADSGDLLFAISSSGKSENILRAVRLARSRRCRIITFSGFKPNNPLRRLGDLNFYVSAQHYGYVELTHSALAHFLTDHTVAIVKDKIPLNLPLCKRGKKGD